MVATWAVLFGILLLFGWFAASIVLLVNRRTRVAGFVVLAAPLVLFFIAAVFVLLLRFRAAPVALPRDMSRQEQHRAVEAVPRVERNDAAEPKKDAAKAPVAQGKPPDWVNKPPHVVDDSYEMPIVVGPYTTRQECDAKLPEELQNAVDRYAEMCLGEPPAARIVLPADYLRQHLVRDQWEEVREYSVGPMTQLHVLLRFDPEAKDRILAEHRRGIVAARLWLTGIGLAAVLGLLAAVYAYLRIGMATRLAHRTPEPSSPTAP